MSPLAGELERAVIAIAGDLMQRAPGRVHAEAATVFERALIQHVLLVTGGNQLRAARLLGMNRNTLRKRARQLDVHPAGASPGPVTG
jgi:DNA-binding protein Fis